MTRGENDLYWEDLCVGDYNQLHVDEEFARTATIHGRRIAHGLPGLSIASGLFTRTWLGAGIQRHMIAMLGFEWRFRAPLFIGDTITVEVTVSSLSETSDETRGVGVLERNVRNQVDTVIQSGTTTMLLTRRR